MQRQQRWIDYTGLNLIRIVIGSYFMAISLGLIDGSDPRVLFVPFLSVQVADLVTTVLLFAVTAAFMIGIYLRLTSLILAIFMLASSYVDNFMLPETVQVAEFWRDLTLVCAVLLCYSCLKRSELRKATLLGRRRGWKLPQSQTVTPRRVAAAAPSKAARLAAAPHYQAALEPLFQRSSVDNTPATAPLDDPPAAPHIKTARKRHLALVANEDDDQPDNIFVSM